MVHCYFVFFKSVGEFLLLSYKYNMNNNIDIWTNQANLSFSIIQGKVFQKENCWRTAMFMEKAIQYSFLLFGVEVLSFATSY